MRLTLSLAMLLAVSPGWSQEPTTLPRPTPLTRPEMKAMLEAMKQRPPRVPLPALTPEERQRLGEREPTYENRLRALYLPTLDPRQSGYGSRDPDPKATLENPFKVRLFWIVSRTNNCQYCLGHQESKLLNAGMTEDQIAALDGDWERFPPAEREAFAFARRFTFEPHRLDDASIRGLRAHFSESQCLEMILSMGGNNAINRWKDGIGVPQSADGGGSIGRKEKAPNDPPHTYKTPTAEAYRDRPSGVAALVRDEQGTPTRQTRCDRPALESNQELAERLAEARRRESRFVLESAEATARLTDRKHPEALIPNWMRLLARFRVLGKARITAQLQAEELPQLSETLRGQLGWIVARQDRSWYMLGLAERRLRGAGMTPAQIEKLDTDWAGFSPRERALFRLAKHLAASPVVLTDSEVASAIKEAGNEQVVQCIHYVALLASLGRITEAAGLTLEP